VSKRKQKRNRFRNRQQEQRLQLNERRRREFNTRSAGLDANRILFLPLDIGKNAHWMRADTGSGRVVHAPKKLTSDQAGYTYFCQTTRGYLPGGQFDLVVTGHEYTGFYHENWSANLQTDFQAELAEGADPQFLYRLINPYHSKLERQKLSLRPRNTDPIAWQAIAALLQPGQGTPATWPEPQVAQLHQYVFFARQAMRRLRATRNDLLRHFDRIWPGAVVNLRRFRRAHPDLPEPIPIVQSNPLERLAFRILVEHCPNPYQVRPRLKITRRGDGFHRHTRTWMANLVAGHHPTFGQTFVAAEERGLGVWGAAIHTAHKLNRTGFRLLLEDRPYRDDTPPNNFPRWRHYWWAYRKHRRQPNHYPHPGPWRPLD
jgi:hypothetical protein